MKMPFDTVFGHFEHSEQEKMFGISENKLDREKFNRHFACDYRTWLRIPINFDFRNLNFDTNAILRHVSCVTNSILAFFLYERHIIRFRYFETPKLSFMMTP